MKRRLRVRVGEGAVVSDTAPFITLARIGRLEVLREVFEAIVVPGAVHEEFAIGSGRIGADAFADALAEGWVIVRKVRDRAVLSTLLGSLGQGEAEAITLAHELSSNAVLLDDELAREFAAARSLPIQRTIDVLVTAKQRGLIHSLADELRRCERTGYRIAPQVADDALKAAGEGR